MMCVVLGATMSAATGTTGVTMCMMLGPIAVVRATIVTM
jgi:hypothetical protein